MRRWQATTAGAAAAVALVVAGVATVRLGASPSSTSSAGAVAAPTRLRFEPVDGARSDPLPQAPPLAAGSPPAAVAPPDATPVAPAIPPPPPGPDEVEIAPPPAKFEAPPAPPPPPPEPLRQSQSAPRGGGVWAVMIGIDDYPGTRSDLRSAVNDANDVNEALARYGVAGDHRLLIRNGQATAGVLLAAADWLVARAGPDATAVFFYAGHVRKLGGATEAMVGADGRVVTDAQLAGRLQGLQAARTWIAIAGCYGGGFVETLAPGRVLTAAADADHLAYENSAFGRSYLVQFMVREAMIQGRAPQSVQSAYAYAKAEIDRRYPGRAPVQYDRSGGSVVLRQSASAPAPPPSSSPSGGGSTGGSTGSTGGGSGDEEPDGSCTKLGLVSWNCDSARRARVTVAA